MDEKPVNFTTIGSFLKLKPQTIYTWYRQYLSGYPEAVNSGEWGKNDFVSSDKRKKVVPILKSENLGEEMAVDEKMIDQEFYTVLTNRHTGKIALLAETLQVADLSDLITKMGEAANEVKEITMDLSATYEKLAEQCFPKATVIADKFHVVQHIVEAVQAFRLRLKQEELSKIPATKKNAGSMKKKPDLPTEKAALRCLPEVDICYSKKKKTGQFRKRKGLLCYSKHFHK